MLEVVALNWLGQGSTFRYIVNNCRNIMTCMNIFDSHKYASKN